MDSYENEIVALITKSYAEEDALKYKAHVITQSEMETIVKIGKEVLSNFPILPNSCAPMTALWVAIVRNNTDIPAHMIGGSLYFKGKKIFGSDIKINFTELLSSSRDDWDGHFWATFGNFIGEISFFRTAYSQYSPPWLKNMVTESFGEGKGMLLAEPHTMKNKHKFEYIPQYAVTGIELTSLVNGAKALHMSLLST